MFKLMGGGLRAETQFEIEGGVEGRVMFKLRRLRGESHVRVGGRGLRVLFKGMGVWMALESCSSWEEG